MKDLFSAQSETYAKFRPVYPAQLYDFIYAHVNGFNAAWDCATGNGQVARELAKRFSSVLATDISNNQLAQATGASNVTYKQSNESLSFIKNPQFDLVTVAAALHWLNFDTFYSTIRRVVKRGGFFAAWCYSLLRVNAETDLLFDRFTTETMGPYWDKERRYVDENYRTVPFPFREIEVPSLYIIEQWDIEHLSGYFTSWSSVQHYIRQHGTSPVPQLIEQVRPHWKGRMEIRMPLAMRAGFVD
jgi:SAM-dependent methyltransferase